jgi:hypothetical protein
MLEGPQRLYIERGVSVFWNEASRSKLRGITELKPSELPEIFGVRFRIWSGPEGVFIAAFEQAESRWCR